MIRIERDALKKMLMEAYECGWGGCLELKEAHADRVMDGLKDAEDLAKTSSITLLSSPSISTSAIASSEISTYDVSLNPNYYSYYSSGGTVFVNEPGEDAI